MRDASGKIGRQVESSDHLHVSGCMVDVRPCRNGFIVAVRHYGMDSREEWAFPDSVTLGKWIAGWDRERDGK